MNQSRTNANSDSYKISPPIYSNVVKGDPKTPFSMAITPSCWRGHYSIPEIAPLYIWSLP